MTLLVLGSLAPALLPAAGQPETAESLIASLAKPAPATIDFTEVRFSALFKQPMVVSGQLHYGGPESLDRRITRPYREEAQIRGNAVRIRREDEPERSFAIKRAPELQLLLHTFTAMLEGEAEAITRDFEVAAERDDSKWELRLTPKDSRIARRIERIRIVGRNDMPRCMTIVNDEHGASIMLLGAASQTPLPQVPTQEWLERMCASSE